jgi:ElaB/YqjD/DUF883 family membrane-anchored ribosome-binding protein
MAEKILSVRERITSLETLTKERWDGHDKRSDENWKKVNKTLDEISIFMREEGKRKEGCMKEAKDHSEKYTNKAVSWALGVPATLGVIFGLFVMVHKILTK